MPRSSQLAQPAAQPQGRPLALVADDCLHDGLIVYLSRGDVFDDHRTSYGPCRDCGVWAVRTDFANGAIETRPCTPAEMQNLQAREDRYRRADAE
jgi:hypothetical protein